jgi:AraC-like DNA-binding protein
MPQPPAHHAIVDACPWVGIFGTRIESARHYGRHWHATHGIGLVERGGHRSASGRGPVDAHAGDTIATNPGEVHDGRPLGGTSRRWRMLYFDPGVLAAWAGVPGELELTRPAARDPVLAGQLQRLFGRLDGWQARRTDLGRLACDEALAQLCAALPGRLATAAAGPPEVPADVRRARDRLAADLLQAPSLDELAALAGLGKYQLLRRFTQVHGLPPHAWLLQQRVERARASIRRGASLVQAAADAGFADQSHMTRMFVRHFGFTPGAWRRAVAAPQ